MGLTHDMYLMLWAWQSTLCSSSIITIHPLNSLCGAIFIPTFEAKPDFEYKITQAKSQK